MSDGHDEHAAWTLEQFERLLDAYGARPEAWPDDVREQALALVAASPEARRMQLEAAAVDQMLGALACPEPSAALRERILEAAPKARHGRVADWLGRWWPYTPAWQPMAALAAAAVFGLTVGLIFNTSTQQPVELTDAAFASYADWEETP